MGYLRFHKGFRLFPGMRANLSKRGISLSAGGSGASVNIGTTGSRATVGVPGTGLSYIRRSSRVSTGTVWLFVALALMWWLL